MVRLSYAPFDRLLAYLKSSGLYDPRFPLRSDGSAGAFYISGPPVYVELISAAAKYIDATYAKPGTGESTIRVIKLKTVLSTIVLIYSAMLLSPYPVSPRCLTSY